MNKIPIIRQILLHIWDPLDIGGNSNLSDEYDVLANRLNIFLNEPRTYDDVAHVLTEFELELGSSMGYFNGRAPAAAALARISEGYEGPVEQ